MNDYLTKPLDPDQLIDTITKHLLHPGQSPDPDPRNDAPDTSRAQPLASTPPHPAATEDDDAAPLPFNVERVLNRCMGNVQLLEKMLDKFQERSLRDLEDLARFVSEGNAAQAATLAHALKGAAANLSAERVKEVAADIEAMGRSQRLDAAPDQIDRLKSELDRCLEAIPWVLAQAADRSG